MGKFDRHGDRADVRWQASHAPFGTGNITSSAWGALCVVADFGLQSINAILIKKSLNHQIAFSLEKGQV
jgi:hypothetical protein